MDLFTVYLICAAAGGTVLVLRLLLMLTGLHFGSPDADAPADVDAGADTGDLDQGMAGEVNFLSVQSLSGFFTMFGLVGMGLLQVHSGQLWSLLGALGAGLVTAWVSGMIVLALQRLQTTGNEVIDNAVGQQGTVYLTIPEQGTGIITITIQGAQRQFDAVSETGEAIPTGSIVRVTGHSAGSLLVVNRETIRSSIPIQEG